MAFVRPQLINHSFRAKRSFPFSRYLRHGVKWGKYKIGEGDEGWEKRGGMKEGKRVEGDGGGGDEGGEIGEEMGDERREVWGLNPSGGGGHHLSGPVVHYYGPTNQYHHHTAYLYYHTIGVTRMNQKHCTKEFF